jgi:hypothetical protein
VIAFDGLIGLLLLGFWLWALLDCIVSPKEDVRNLPKLLWVLLIVLLWVFGALAWAFLGHTPRSRRRAGGGRADRSGLAAEPARRPSRLDDLPASSASATPEHITDARSAELDRQIEAWEAEQRKGDAAG